MLTELQRRAVWEGWINGEMRAYYFADLCGRYHRRHRLLTWGSVVCSSSAAGAFVAGLPSGYGWIAPALALGTALLSGYSLAVQTQQQAMQSADLHARWSSLANAWRALWDGQHAPDAPQTVVTLLAREEDVSKASLPFPVKTRLLAKWQDYVFAQHADLIKQTA